MLSSYFGKDNYNKVLLFNKDTVGQENAQIFLFDPNATEIDKQFEKELDFDTGLGLGPICVVVHDKIHIFCSDVHQNIIK